MKNLIYCILLLASVAQAQQTASQLPSTHTPLKVGDEVNTNIQTTHPYNTTAQTGIIFEQTFYNKNSSYIKLYFENFDLGPEDYVEISTHNTGESVIYAGKGKIIDDQGTMISNFWSMGLFDEQVTVRLHAVSTSNHYGFKISRVAYGYPQSQIDAILSAEKSICGSDNKQRVACVNGTMFTKSNAVCRLLINGSSLCTGWLLGSEGHIMTNEHCIGNSSDAQNTDFRFNYQYSQCSGGGLATSNTVASTSTFIKTNASLDYTLVKLPSNPTGTYGYLQLSPTAASVGDRIYIPQHPGGRPKEIATTQDQNGSGPAVVATSTTSGVRYYADTEGGSSGSPVLDYNTHQVIAIHNTGGCTNGSYGRSDRLISSIGSDMPNNGVGGGGSGPNPTGCTSTRSSFPYNEGFETGLGAWTNATSDDFNWTRGSGSTPSSSTGPSSAQAGSYYIYVEASRPNYPSKNTILNGPCLDLRNVSSPTMSFNYHMYGSSIGDVKLQVSTNGTSWTTVWQKSGDQGNAWRSASVSLNSYTSASNLRIRFNATTGNSYRGDIALDNIGVQGGSTGGGCNTGNVVDSWESNFEGWTNNSGDDFNWTRGSGNTPSRNTGPSSAYNGSQYIYMESSSPNYSTKTAILTSPCQNLSNASNPSVNFRYHMYGASNMGTLRLQVSVNNGGWTTIWSRTGNQGNSWQYASVSLNSYKGSNVKLRFNGTTGTTWQGDMAVDYFRIAGTESAAVETATLEDASFLEVFPNPFSHYLNISTNLQGQQGYRLMNIQGQVIQEGTVTDHQIALPQVAPGVYFIAVYNDEEQLVRKIIKQ